MILDPTNIKEYNLILKAISNKSIEIFDMKDAYLVNKDKLQMIQAVIQNISFTSQDAFNQFKNNFSIEVFGNLEVSLRSDSLSMNVNQKIDELTISSDEMRYHNLALIVNKNRESCEEEYYNLMKEQFPEEFKTWIIDTFNYFLEEKMKYPVIGFSQSYYKGKIILLDSHFNTEDFLPQSEHFQDQYNFRRFIIKDLIKEFDLFKRFPDNDSFMINKDTFHANLKLLPKPIRVARNRLSFYDPDETEDKRYLFQPLLICDSYSIVSSVSKYGDLNKIFLSALENSGYHLDELEWEFPSKDNKEISVLLLFKGKTSDAKCIYSLKDDEGECKVLDNDQIIEIAEMIDSVCNDDFIAISGVSWRLFLNRNSLYELSINKTERYIRFVCETGKKYLINEYLEDICTFSFEYIYKELENRLFEHELATLRLSSEI